MKKNNWKSMVGCGVAAMTICMGAMTAMAADGDAVSTNSEATGTTYNVQNLKFDFTKDLKIAEGIKVPGVTFNFTATSETPDAPTAKIDPITYSGADTPSTALAENEIQNAYHLNKPSTISFGEFQHAGMYQYTVKETAESSALSGGTMKYSTAEYKMRVYVVNEGESGLKIENVTIENEDGKKVDNIKFENIYTKNASLTISKMTDGDQANRKKDFEFTLTFTKSGTADSDTYEGTIGNNPIKFEAGVAKKFYLHHGETLEFDSLPAGTRYVVEETGTADYTPSVKVVENGTKTVEKAAAKGASLASAETNKTNLVGEGTNTADFTNTYDDVPITGLILNNLPFAILIGAAAALLALGTFARKFKTVK